MPCIRQPRHHELEALRAIERDAGRLFTSVGMPEIAGDDPLSVTALEIARAEGRLWVAVDERDRPIAYLVSSVVDGCAHIEQVSVGSAHAGRRLGAALIEHLARIAMAEARPAQTLTTFRDVPWNAPYYERLGFVVFEPTDHGPEMVALVSRELAAIPSDAARVAMRRRLTGSRLLAGQISD